LAGGTPILPAYLLYENPTVFPRCFMVFHARPLPSEKRALEALTTTDLHREALLEGDITPAAEYEYEPARQAVIGRYEPNRVEIAVGNGPAGWLVLADLWYPGWHCRLDGLDTPIRRANYLFRAVWVPARPLTAVFSFEPQCYHLGRVISLATLVLVTVILLIASVANVPWRRLSGARGPATAPGQ
jgi:hypothetical protein